jgi:hypothetical protein
MEGEVNLMDEDGTLACWNLVVRDKLALEKGSTNMIVTHGVG